MDNFTGKVVLVTGASSGIGAGTAVDFARCGAKLALTGRDELNLQTVRQRCIAEGADVEEVLCIAGDLTVDEDVTRIINETTSHFGTIHILVNNAGAASVLSMQETTPEVFDEMYNVNLRQVFMMTRGVLDRIIENKGAIVNVSSIAGSRAIVKGAAYGVMKAGVHHFTQCLAQELGSKGVRVNTVILGVFDTPIFTRPGGVLEGLEHAKDEFLAAAAKAHPLGRIGDVEDASRAIRFLASEAASFITGALLPVDGGRSGCSPMKHIVPHNE